MYSQSQFLYAYNVFFLSLSHQGVVWPEYLFFSFFFNFGPDMDTEMGMVYACT